MSFKDLLAADAINTFANLNEFAEEIVYTPYGGTAKTISAIVERSIIGPSGADGGKTLSRTAEIMIANNATAGHDAVMKGMDKVSMPRIPGASVIDWIVEDIISVDAGAWHLKVKC